MMNATQLRKAVLQLAIQGKLVPQIASEEPASVLLEKIKAEKQELIKQGKIKKEKVLSTISDDEKSFNIPDSWEWVRLEDIGIYGSGYTPNKKDLSKEGSIPFFKVSDMNAHENAKYMTVSSTFYIGMSKKLFPPNSIIFPKNGGAVFTNKKRILKKAAIIDLNTGFFLPMKNLCFDYAFLLFTTIDFKKHYKGTALPTIDTNFLSIILGLPPLEEQKRIVAKVEELMAKIDEYEKYETDLSKLEKNIQENLKKSILQYAIQGKLMPQIASEEPASVLIEKIKVEKQELIKQGKIKKEKVLPAIKESEVPFKIPESWEWLRFNDIVNFNLGKTPERSDNKFWDDGKYNWVSISDMKNFQTITTTKEKISQIAMEKYFNNVLVKAGTLIMSFKLTVGRVSILGMDAVHNEAIISIFPYDCCGNATKKFLFHILKEMTDYVDKTDAIKGSTLNSDKIKKMLIPLPPLAEQQRTVDKIEQLFSVIDNLFGEKQKNVSLSKRLEIVKPKSSDKSVMIAQAAQGDAKNLDKLFEE